MEVGTISMQSVVLQVKECHIVHQQPWHKKHSRVASHPLELAAMDTFKHHKHLLMALSPSLITGKAHDMHFVTPSPSRRLHA